MGGREGERREGVWMGGGGERGGMEGRGQHMYEQKTICCALGLRLSILVGRHNIMIV